MRQQKTRLCLAALLAVALLGLPAAAKVKNPRDIEYPPIPEFKIERPDRFTLKNGMTVFLLEDRELPLIEVIARIRTGSNYEPADKTGLAGIFGQVLREGGTTSMTGDEIDDFLEARAASIETSVGGDSGYASMNCLKEDFADVFGLFNEILRNPVFAEDKVELARVQVNTGIARRNDDVGSIVGREFRRLIYGKDSPLGRLAEYATVANISRDDLAAWHAKYLHPNNIYLGVVGDFETEEMKRRIREKLEGWPKGPAFAEPEVVYDKAPRPGVFFIEKEDVTQANIRLGHLGIEMSNPDYFAVEVMNEVLGGGFAGRLFSTVRSEKGLAYSVFGGVGASIVRQGIFQVGLSTKSETMAQAVEALEEEITGIINRPATEKEMQRAKESILNSFVFNYDSKSEVLGQQVTYAYYGYPADFLETYRSKIEKVSIEDVARVAKKYIHPDKVVTLVVGKAEEFDRPVTSFGEVTEIDIAIPAPPDTTPKVARTTQSVDAGAEILARASRMIGGSGTAEIRTVKMNLETAFSIQGQTFSVDQEVAVELPDKLRQSSSTPMGQMVVVINGDKGSFSRGGQSQPLPGEAIEESHRQLERDLLVLFGRSADGLEAVAAGSEEVDGRGCELVAVTRGDSESRLCVDAEGKVLRQSFNGKHPMQGIPGRIEIDFLDYREVDGRMIPHKRVMRFDGQDVATTTLESIVIDPELDPATFEVSPGGD